MNNNSLLLLCLLLIGSAYCEYASACDSEISHPIMVEVPLNADPRQTALIVANAVLDDVNNLHPHETRCNVATLHSQLRLSEAFSLRRYHRLLLEKLHRAKIGRTYFQA